MLSRIRHIVCIAVLILNFGTNQGQQPSVYRVTRMSFNDAIFSEISPVIVNDGIVFCSDRRFSAVKDRKSFEGKRIYNIYMAQRKDTSDYIRPVMLRSERSELFNNGPLCFAPDGKTVYFTSEVETGNLTKKRTYINHSGLFTAELSGNELVSLIPFPFNSNEYNIAQPSISADGRYLYFASDMPGGQGGSDLYFSEKVNGQWSKPVNLGPVINSAGTENFPFIHSSGRLYFSSDRTGGIGRLDVYYTSLNAGKWDNPVLVPEPVNSTADDFAFVAEDDLQTGFFSSDRRTNDDIYRFASTIIRKTVCDTLVENNYCYELIEENAVKFDTLPFRYEWKYGDGNKGIGPSVIYCYPGPGSYIIQLDVVNLITGEVMYNEKTYKLEITDVEQPYISVAEKGTAGDGIMFSAENTNLPGWKIARYYWNFGDETVSTGKEVNKTFMKPGTYNVQLIVTAEPEPGGIIREACVCRNIVILPGL
jgi:hypothetical protein